MRMKNSLKTTLPWNQMQMKSIPYGWTLLVLHRRSPRKAMWLLMDLKKQGRKLEWRQTTVQQPIHCCWNRGVPSQPTTHRNLQRYLYVYAALCYHCKLNTHFKYFTFHMNYLWKIHLLVRIIDFYFNSNECLTSGKICAKYKEAHGLKKKISKVYT